MGKEDLAVDPPAAFALYQHKEIRVAGAAPVQQFEPALDARAQLVKIACARADRDAAALAEGASALVRFRDAMPWQKRIAERWRAELAAA